MFSIATLRTSMECDTLVKAMHEIQNICIYANLRHTFVNQQGILTFTSF